MTRTRRGSAAATKTQTAYCDYFPKGADLANVSPEELQRVADEINDRLRKTLGWARPPT